MSSNQKKEKKLPIILSVSEISRILEKVRNPGYRVCLTIIYSCGLRVSEGINLTVNDIDKERMAIRIIAGKNGKDRYVPLPEYSYKLLKEYWIKNKPAPYLFPSREKNVVTRTTIYNVFKEALQASGVKKNVSVHNLRHSFATHLLENNVSLIAIQKTLGHKSPTTTAVYTQLSQSINQKLTRTMNQIARQV